MSTMPGARPRPKAGGPEVRADHVGRKAETRSLQQDVPGATQARKMSSGRNAENRALTHVNDEGREAGDVAAAGQKLAEAAQEDHHRAGYEDRMRPYIGDDDTHGAADNCPGEQRGHDADGKTATPASAPP